MDVKYVEIGGSFSKRIQCKRNHCSKEYGEEIAGRTTSTYYEHNCIGNKQDVDMNEIEEVSHKIK